MDPKEVKARLSGKWAEVISSLCRVDPAVLDGDHHPCPKCGGTKRFNLSREGDGKAFCNDCPDGPEVASSGIDTIMWLNGWDFPRAMRELEAYLAPPAVALTQEVRAVRHRVYSKLASLFGLADKHRGSLAARGLPEIEIEHRQYWSLVESPTMKLMKEFGEDRVEISKSVPGVMPGGSLTIAASNCLMIPVRSVDGEVVGIQYRPDQRRPGEAKYLWLSSKDRGAPASSLCHFALPPADREFAPKIVRLTEGPLKADIAAAISGIRTLAIAGVNSWKAGVAGVKSLSPEFVYLAFDSDAFTNGGVARAVVDAYEDLLKAGFLVQMEVWDSIHKGIDDALSAGATVTALPIEETKKRIDQLRLVKKEAGKDSRLRNFKLVPSKSDNPNKAWDKSPMLIPDIADKLLELTGGWPKCCDGQLFVQSKDGEIRRFTTCDQLFGWIGSRLPVEFAAGDGCPSKKEFFSQLPFHVESFVDTEEWPHFPPIHGNYYSRKVEPGTGERLEEFLDFFSPATEFDRELILAFIATTFWGGSPGRRVCFVIDSVGGTGAGKSELAKRVARLTGGNYEFDAKKIEEETLRKALVNGEKHRVALLDNVKDSVLSSSIIESLVTSATVAGHRLHVGYGSRPNTITWAVTMNGAAMSRDLAQRAVLIKLTIPVRSGTWDDDVDKFLTDHQQELVADIAAFFEREPVKLSRWTRWASWEGAILARLKNPEALQKMIENRVSEADEDKTTAESIIEYFGEQLRDLGYDPESDVVHIPSDIARSWLVESTGKEHTQRSAFANIKQLIDGGSLKNFRLNPCKSYGRGWIWNSSKGNDAVKYTLKKTIDAKKAKDAF